ncbi:hypothetical protein FR483_n090R [Paramecium bursaria Chlorella virus FR483]|uniref:Uncharacterized protein n090R n=1 Tax=Paramecium bursaria Chlorella virus FR483 TaxID=399781 RepID=A7J6E4_PBCVF|nr:hypothetical protein FR483_n090R [Paramecium bursaria Chlorella virus FR483]ABT15375.1 hypothetical protein FR483_n090R [Paramecium bursaria Chlorella virus FR483]
MYLGRKHHSTFGPLGEYDSHRCFRTTRNHESSVRICCGLHDFPPPFMSHQLDHDVVDKSGRQDFNDAPCVICRDV